MPSPLKGLTRAQIQAQAARRRAALAAEQARKKAAKAAGGTAKKPVPRVKRAAGKTESRRKGQSRIKTAKKARVR